MKKRQSRTIYLLVFDGCQILDFAGPAQVFTTASQHIRDGVESYGGYDVKLVSANVSVTTATGIDVTCLPFPRRLRAESTLLVAGGGGVSAVAASTDYEKWVKRSLQYCQRWGSVCTGSLALAAWGLLDGKTATTHWRHLNELAKHTAVTLEEDALFVNDGAVWTSAGISAGIDMALAMVAEDAGTVVANQTAQHMVLATKRAGHQTQYSDLVALSLRDPQGDFAALHDWMQANLSRPIALSDMADFCATTVRTLQRRYKANLKTSPLKTLKQLRMQKAKNLLRSSDAAVTLVASECGFNSVQQFSKDFRSIFGVSPLQFRGQ
ncbi:MAG: helix-turn-helix domain-containing protein [Pseudomonadota bacterium]